MKCIAVGCTSGYKSNPEKVHFFRVPKDNDKVKEWQKASRRNDIILNSSHCFCEKHFTKHDIVWKKVFHNQNGEIIQEIPLKRPYVKEGVIPSLFPWTEFTNENSVIKDTENIKSASLKGSNNREKEKETKESSNTVTTLTFNDLKYNDKLYIPFGWTRNILPLETASVIIYSKMMCKTIETKSQLICAKEIWITEDMKIQVKALGKPLSLNVFGISNEHECLTSLDILEDLIKTVQTFNICEAYEKNEKNYETEYTSVALKESNNILRHKQCPILLENLTQCTFCKNLKYTLDRKRKRLNGLNAKESEMKRIRIDNLSPTKKNVVDEIRKQKHNLIRCKRRQKCTIQKLQGEIKKIQDDLNTKNEQMLQEAMAGKNIPIYQQEALKEILSASSRKSAKGRRYSDRWILLCLLFHMKSPKGYDFILSNKVLPLPSPSTIRRYLSCIESCCGFDSTFFEMFKTKMLERNENERHGILLLDEMATRESVYVKSKNLTFTGLVDFGNDHLKKAENFDDKANHGLVFMYQPLDASHAAQPIAVFASRGPTEGTVLAELVIKAIVLLENSGVKIHGVVTDGAATNRKFWSIMGVSGKKNELKTWFTHVLDSSRKVFVFSDTPHLMKTIRNRLYDNDLKIKPEGSVISWKHFEKLHEKDRGMPMPICPRITKHHLELHNSSKMCVRLAVQILSNSVAKGLRYYSSYHRELKDSTETAEFCEWINSMFDSLNRREYQNGLKPGNKYFLILQESLHKLDQWENLKEEGIITNNEFLTRQTAEGLRVTLQSMIDLTLYLTSEYNFPCILSGNINQDALERFFGCVRQAGGSNDHPATPTFLQIYKILCSYSILSPPKYGNCTIEKEVKSPLISLNEIKSLYQKSKENRELLIDTIKSKLNNAIKNDDWNIYDIIESEHDYDTPAALDCVIYYITGRVCYQLLQFTKCSLCQEALITNSTIYNKKAELGDMLLESFVHPNEGLYNFVKNLEQIFMKHCHQLNVADAVLSNIIDSDVLTFPCEAHKIDIISYIIYYFLQIRLSQYCRNLNNNTKNNQRIKKISKHCKT